MPAGEQAREGAAARHPVTSAFLDNYSAWVIAVDENKQFGGQVVNVFYVNDRVLDGDTFWIAIAGA